MHFTLQFVLVVIVLSALVDSSVALRYEDDVKICIYIENSTYIERKLSDFKLILDDLQFKSVLPTILYIHGWTEGHHSRSVKTVFDAYKKKGGFNFLMLNWNAFASSEYFLVSLPNLYKIGDLVAKYLLEFLNAGYPLDKLHVIGHSLGGQMVGKVGRSIISQTAGRTILPRITALDPAGPGFYPTPVVLFQKAISSSDAAFVDIIHTDGGKLGSIFSGGHADFFVNGGFPTQPGCVADVADSMDITNACSHYRSWMYYSESVLRPTAFPAIECNSWLDFSSTNTGCYRMAKAYMGYSVYKGIRGNFYLQTNSEELYGKGDDGLNYHSTIIEAIKQYR